MTESESLAAFASQARDDDLSDAARMQLKIRILDALGCAIGAVDAPPLRLLRALVDEFGAEGTTTLIGCGRTTPDWATFYNAALVRYLDFNDSYLAPGETCHPSDTLAGVLAATEYAGRSGRDLLAALAVAYQVQCRLSDVAPVRARGFDHTAQGVYAVTAGIARGLGLDATRTAHALGLAGASLAGLRVTRTGTLSHWKGLAAPFTSFAAMELAQLAMRGITGPLEVFEGTHGFKETISGPFEIDWGQEDLEAVRRTILKRYNAEVHSQSILAAVLALRETEEFAPADVRHVAIETFDVAYHIIGGGDAGDKYQVGTKEEADHSLPYLVAVALLDGTVMPAQFAPERIARRDVQQLLHRVTVRPDAALSRRFPAELPARVSLWLADGRTLTDSVSDYEGFITRPMRWERAVEKFDLLAAPYASADLRRQIVGVVADLEHHMAVDLTRLLARAATPERRSLCLMSEPVAIESDASHVR